MYNNIEDIKIQYKLLLYDYNNLKREYQKIEDEINSKNLEYFRIEKQNNNLQENLADLEEKYNRLINENKILLEKYNSLENNLINLFNLLKFIIIYKIIVFNYFQKLFLNIILIMKMLHYKKTMII